MIMKKEQNEHIRKIGIIQNTLTFYLPLKFVQIEKVGKIPKIFF